MSPENSWLEDVFPIEIVPFLEDMLVFRGVKQQLKIGFPSGSRNILKSPNGPIALAVRPRNFYQSQSNLSTR